VWWYTPIIPALGKLRQEYCKFKANQGYIARPYLKNNKKKVKHIACPMRRASMEKNKAEQSATECSSGRWGNFE
jgi:hypothetical protein